MNLKYSKAELLNTIQTLLIILLIGGLLGEQFKYLLTYYSKYIAHWTICLMLFGVAFYISKKLLSLSNLQYFILNIFFLLIAFQGFNLVLKLHEYSHLSYLLSYVLIMIAGSFFAFSQKTLNLHFLKRLFKYIPNIFRQTIIRNRQLSIIWSYISIISIGLTGFTWRYYLKNDNIYFFLILLIIITFIYSLYQQKKSKFQIVLLTLLLPIFIGLKINVESIELFKNQSQYADRIIFSQQTDHYQVDITSWRGNHWFYYNGKIQFSTVDEWLYSESMVHPLMQLLHNQEKILVIGGENGILIKELLKYNNVNTIDLFILDSALFTLATQEPLFTEVNQHALESSKLKLHSGDIINFLNKKQNYYNAIFIDTSDPVNEKWNTYYTNEFYNTCYTVLHKKGLIITQAGSPYFATKAFVSIEKTLQSVNFYTLPIHNQVLTLGEWGWILSSKNISTQSMKSQLLNSNLLPISTKWLNQEALQMLISFGKPLITIDSVKINTLKNPVLIDYYQEGNFKFK